MFGKLANLDFKAMMPLLEEKFGLKKEDINTADEFKTGLQTLNMGAGPDAQRFLVQGEFNGRKIVAVVVLK